MFQYYNSLRLVYCQVNETYMTLLLQLAACDPDWLVSEVSCRLLPLP
jgi:hypothetical protein